MDTVDSLKYVLGRLASVTVMTVDPGFLRAQPFYSRDAGQNQLTKELEIKHGYTYEIEVDGRCEPPHLPKADRCRCGAFCFRGVRGSLAWLTLWREAVEKARSYIPFKNGGQGVSSMTRITSALGIDIGGTNIRLAHVDSNLQVLRSLKVKVEEAEDGLVNFLSSAVEEFVSGGRDSPSVPLGSGIHGIVGSQGEILSPAPTWISLLPV